jgi:hypothetical protein
LYYRWVYVVPLFRLVWGFIIHSVKQHSVPFSGRNIKSIQHRGHLFGEVLAGVVICSAMPAVKAVVRGHPIIKHKAGALAFFAVVVTNFTQHTPPSTTVRSFG